MFANEVKRVAFVVVTQHILGGQATVEGVQGTWADSIRNMYTVALLPALGCEVDICLLENG